jgi:adenylosuccinate synthase
MNRQRQAIVVTGLGFGDEGKGTTVEALVHRHDIDLVVRYNGGAQAAHNVVTPDDKHHTFSQFGSGSLLGARTFLSEHMLVEPISLGNEARHLHELGLADPFELLTIDRRAVVITPYHIRANRYREARRGKARHGTCGMGIGEARQDALENPDDVLRVGDLLDWRALLDKLFRAQARLREEFPDEDAGASPLLVRHTYGQCAKRLRIVDGTWLGEQLRKGSAVFEGAQGVLLDQTWGFQPHTTWSDTTFAWADALLKACEFDGKVERVGVTRAYTTRHGAGPLPTEYPQDGPNELHNSGGHAGSFRKGDLDVPLLRYALDVCGGVDSIALTHVDRQDRWSICTAYGDANTRDNGMFWSSGTWLGGRSMRGQIIRPHATTFERQQQLTKVLNSLNATEFMHAHVASRALPTWLAEELRVPIKLVSQGPTREHKVWL